MADGVLYDVAAGIIGKAGNLALKEIVLIWSVNDEITKLGETVSIIKAVLLDAEAKQHKSEAIKLWLKSLKDAMCDALKDWLVPLEQKPSLVKPCKQVCFYLIVKLKLNKTFLRNKQRPTQNKTHN